MHNISGPKDHNNICSLALNILDITSCGLLSTSTSVKSILCMIFHIWLYHSTFAKNIESAIKVIGCRVSIISTDRSHSLSVRACLPLFNPHCYIVYYVLFGIHKSPSITYCMDVHIKLNRIYRHIANIQEWTNTNCELLYFCSFPHWYLEQCKYQNPQMVYH